MYLKIYNSILIFKLIIEACIKIVRIFFAFDGQRKDNFKQILCGGASVCAFFYQPIILLWVGCLFDDLISNFFIKKEVILSDWVILVAVAIILLVVAIFINAIFELYFYVDSKGKPYIKVFRAQKNGNNFMGLLITLFTFFIMFYSTDKMVDNAVLCVYFIDVLLCIIATKIYEVFLLKCHAMKNIYDDLHHCYIFKKRY